jgi:hypothetical protein
VRRKKSDYWQRSKNQGKKNAVALNALSESPGIRNLDLVSYISTTYIPFVAVLSPHIKNKVTTHQIDTKAHRQDRLRRQDMNNMPLSFRRR